MALLADTPVPATGFDPSAAQVQRDPYPYYRWLLRNDPVHHGTMGIWFVSRYADVRAVLSDERFIRAGVRDLWTALTGPGPLSEIVRDTILFQDEPDHGRLRTLIGAAFAPRRLRLLETRITKIVDGLLAPVLERGEMDVVNDFAYPLPLTVISHLLGLPPEDRTRIRAWSRAVGPTLDLVASPDEIARGQTAMAEFAAYLGELIASRRGEPGDDLLALMLRANDNQQGSVAEGISVNEILSMVITLIFAGHETVTNQIGNGLLALLRNRDQLELLRREPDRVTNAVDECLRYDSSVQSNSRQLAADFEFHGRTMRRGEFVVVLLGAANRDPAQFADPDRFDVTRTPIHPMSFGVGMRFCLGALLARMELKAALNRIIWLENMRLAIPECDLAYQRSTMFRGLESMPVTFSPIARAAPSQAVAQRPEPGAVFSAPPAAATDSRNLATH
jgi:orsellenic acid P450 oxidase